MLLATPAEAAAQAVASGDTRLPYLWVWIVLAVALIAVLLWLLFGPGARARSRAHLAEQARRELHGRG